MKNELCYLCPRSCAVNRIDQLGYCGAKNKAVVAKIMLHPWEEPCISCGNGSGAVFFSGCALRCVYCQNQAISRNTQNGKIYSPAALAQVFRQLEACGADNINLVTPTHFVPIIIAALDLYKPSLPIIYNSSGYESVKTLRLLEKYIDIYLMDFKYADAQLAKAYSQAENYPQVAKNAILECLRQKPAAVLSGQKMLSGVIIRHLLLPQATKNAMAICDWVSEHAPQAYFSFMCQYTPCGTELPKALQRKVTRREYDKVTAYILQLGLKNVFFQEFDSANNRYIPNFR